MYQDYYQLDADPFRLAADLRFVFPHQGYREAYASMRCALHQGGGVLVITGPPGTGKTMLIESFCAELQSENIAIATLVSTHLPGDDVLCMVAYEFGLDPIQKSRAVILHELKNLLSHEACAVLIVDEAQDLPADALEELRMLSNLKHGSRPLLQIFLIGQETLHQQLHAPGLEQLHQRISAVSRLQRLGLQATHDLLLHRLACAGWRGDPALGAEVFPVIHRFSQGLPRYICKFCSRLFLYGAMNKLQQLSVDHAVAVIAVLEEEMLLPMQSEQDDRVAEPLPHLADLVRSQGRPVAERLSLSDEETAFLADTPMLIDMSLSREVPEPVAESPLESHLPKDARDVRRWPTWIARATVRVAGIPSLGYAALLVALIFGGYQFGFVAGRSTPTVEVVSLPTAGELPTQTKSAVPATLAGLGNPQLQANIKVPLMMSAAFASEPDPSLDQAWIEHGSIMAFQPSKLQAATNPQMTSIPLLLRTDEPTTHLPAGTRDPGNEPIAVVPPSQEEQIAELLRLAEEALASDHLRIPKSGNAWDYYQQVLALDPENTAAEEGFQHIATRYAELARWKLSSQDYDQADVYIDRGLVVLDGHNGLLAVRQEVESQRFAEALAAAVAAAEAAAAEMPEPEPVKTVEPESRGFFAALKRVFGGGEESSE